MLMIPQPVIDVSLCLVQIIVENCSPIYVEDKVSACDTGDRLLSLLCTSMVLE